ncbi:MAG: DUF2845 domain-containing protein [Candidatus Ancaeobacter aquaticus]|nr:DUF2845 domain-containing protein [Candidatus Ancaeobacter aquaticus]
MKRLICLIAVIIMVSGCATTSRVTPKLSLGMTKEEVLSKCGNPVQSGAVQGQDGKALESFMYRESLYSEVTGYKLVPTITYVYFVDNKVIYYGSNPTMPTQGQRGISERTNKGAL